MKITVQIPNLKKMLNVVSLAVVSKSASKTSHALFCPEGEELKAYSTDKDRIAVASCPIQIEGDAQNFTSDPNKLMGLATNSDQESLTLEYLPEKETIRVYASDNSKSYVSMPSFKPEDMISFTDELDKMISVKEVNAGMFLAGVEFSKGFLPSQKKDYFSQVYLSDGAMYSSNGHNRVGAYVSEEWDEIDTLILRDDMIGPIKNLINRTDLQKVYIYTSSKFIGFFSEGMEVGFGFLKTVQEMPKMPLELERPKEKKFTLELAPFKKKIERFHIVEEGSVADLDIRFRLKGEGDEAILEMVTMSDRASNEVMKCSRADGSEDIEFIIKYPNLKAMFSVFQAHKVDIYLEEYSFTVFSEAFLEYKEEVSEEEVSEEEVSEEEVSEEEEENKKKLISLPFAAVGKFSFGAEK